MHHPGLALLHGEQPCSHTESSDFPCSQSKTKTLLSVPTLGTFSLLSDLLQAEQELEISPLALVMVSLWIAAVGWVAVLPQAVTGAACLQPS